MHAGVTAAVSALKGPLHGGANQEVMQLLLDCGNAETAVKKVREMLNDGEKIPGFGHRVYKTFDPRAAFLRKMSKQLGEAAGNTKWYEMSERLIPVVKELKNKDPNVDFFSASAYYTMGIPIDLYTPIFAIARIAGWTAHIMEQHSNNRIIRPQDDYRGPFGRKVEPIEDDIPTLRRPHEEPIGPVIHRRLDCKSPHFQISGGITLARFPFPFPIISSPLPHPLLAFRITIAVFTSPLVDSNNSSRLFAGAIPVNVAKILAPVRNFWFVAFRSTIRFS